MSVILIMAVVLRCVIILLVAGLVLVMLDIHSILMESHAHVRASLLFLFYLFIYLFILALPCLPMLVKPVNGNHNCTGAGDGVTGDVCAYTCDSGYAIEGSEYLTCLETSSWSEVEPSCVEETCNSLTPTEDYLIARPCMTTFGSSCTILCPNGYTNGSSDVDYYQRSCVMDSNNQLTWTETKTCCKL